MKRSFALFLCLVLTLQNIKAQTWTGTTSTNWNVATNWSTGLVPLGADNVTIPGSVVSNNWPSFASDVSINSINMVSGSQLNVNGFMLTLNCLNAYSYFTGASLNNSNGASDIIININGGAGGYAQYFRSNTVNDHIIFNLSGGSDAFYEGDVAPANQFNGNVTFNINGTSPVYISFATASQFSGNLFVIRSIAGSTTMFVTAAYIAGNFSFINNAGGPTKIGNLGSKTNIAGTINIDCNNPATATFEMYNLSNQTTGGAINVQNSAGMNVQKDTLKVTSLSITGYRGNVYAYFYNNSVIGNVTLADDASYSGGYATYLRNNVLTGNTDFSNNGTNAFYDGDAAVTGNIYNGNVTYHGGGSGSLYIAQGSALLCTGNLNIHRTSAGLTQAFNNGSTIGGNFGFNNNTSGNLVLGNISFKTSIGGTVFIGANNISSSSFQMYRLINQTTGGNIIVQNSLAFDVQKDTLKLTAFIISEYTGSNFCYFYNNSVIGNVTFSSAASYSNGYYTSLQNNLITGTSIFTNNGTDPFYEAVFGATSNHFIGNTTFFLNSSGTLAVSHTASSLFDGDLRVIRSVAGTTYVFNAGGSVNGDFSYANNSAGNTYLGNVLIKTSISGTVNITANYTIPNIFEMYRLINQTSGGIINVQNSLGFNVQRDTLKLTSLGITGYTGPSYCYFYNNSVTGNVTLSSAPSYSNGYHTSLQNNYIIGNCFFTNNGTDPFYEAVFGATSNLFIGNTTFSSASSGTLAVSHTASSQFDGNLTVNRSVAGTTYVFNSGGTVNGNFTYTNNSAGNTYLGNGLIKTSISGMMNITANYTIPNNFEMYRLVNQTGGGSIDVQNSLGFDVQKDTLIVINFSITGYRGTNYSRLYNNSITGNVVTTSDVSYSNGYNTTVRDNVITGNSSFTNNGNDAFYDADAGLTGNKYIGNVTYIKTGGSMGAGIAFFNEVSQNLTINSTAGISLGNIRFNGSTNGIIEQLGTQPIIMSNLIMAKTGTGKITLNDSVIVNVSAALNGGNIYSSIGNSLIFIDNATNTSSSATSHVIGPVTKIGDDPFIFPIGGPTTLNTVAISAPVGITSIFSAQYKNQNPSLDGYNTNLKAGSFGAADISEVAYWDVQRISGVTNVSLTLGFGTNPYEQYPVLSNLKVAHWNGAQWDDHGSGGTTGTAANGTVVNSIPITSFSPFTLAGMTSTFFYTYGNPGPGPDGTPVKIGGKGGYSVYSTKQLPGGSYSPDSIYLIANASNVGFKLKDTYGVEKDDTIVTAPIAPVTYISANGNGTVNFTGWRHFVYMRDGSNNIMGAIKDDNLTLGNTTMTTYFSNGNVATSPNGNIYLKRSFKITSQFVPVGTRRVRLYISKTEFTNLQAFDPTAFPSGINSLTITKYSGPMEDSLFNPMVGGNAIIIPNSAITIVDLGTMYSLDIDVIGFSGFYIGGNNSKINICPGSTISLPSNISGSTYQWQLDNGSGFTNLSNGGTYSGTSTSSLILTSAPSSIYGYQLRCVVDGASYSQTYTVKINVSWQGTVSTSWENVANWSCGALPDQNTDVIVNGNKPNFPQINSNSSIRSIIISLGASLNITTGFKLTVLK